MSAFSKFVWVSGLITSISSHKNGSATLSGKLGSKI